MKGDGFHLKKVSSALGGTIGKFKTMEGQVSMAAIVGGTASKLGGGKFANGAVSGAFVHMYNAAGHGAKRQYNREKIDFFEYERKWWSDFFNATDDFISNYTDMRTANTIGADKYFHCTANCQATNRGDGGWNAARFISETRELTDYHIKGDPLNACNEDRVANIQGQRGGECRGTCNGFRPLYLDEQW
jgi:hypothetical protein